MLRYMYGMVCWSADSWSHRVHALLQPSTDRSRLILIIIMFLVFDHPSIEAALVGPASFTQVQVAWHHDNPLVTAPDPLQRRCRVSPSLAARLALPRVGRTAIAIPYTAASVKPWRLSLPVSVSPPPMIVARCSMPCRYIYQDTPIPTVDPGSLQRAHAASRSHS